MVSGKRSRHAHARPRIQRYGVPPQRRTACSCLFDPCAIARTLARLYATLPTHMPACRVLLRTQQPLANASCAMRNARHANTLMFIHREAPRRQPMPDTPPDGRDARVFPPPCERRHARQRHVGARLLLRARALILLSVARCRYALPIHAGAACRR